MRQPTFSRSRRHSRSYRLARTGIAVALFIVVAALIANVIGGGEEEQPIGNVSFSGKASGEGDKRRPAGKDVQGEKDAIIGVLNEWFQQGFVDPDTLAEGDVTDVKELFHKEAQADFDKQVATLTVGDAREQFARVDPQVAKADMAIYFDGGEKPTFATVRVTFSATATMKEEASAPVRIVVSGLFTMEKQGDDWRVKYWSNAKQTQNSIQSTRSPSP